MNLLRTRVDPLHKKRLSKFFGMSLSNPSLPENIKNLFWMYYIPEEKETFAMNNRKEAAFFGLTLMCAMDNMSLYSEDTFESRLWMLENDATESNKRRINAIFMSNITQTSEYIELLGRVLRKPDNLSKIQGVNIDKLMQDLIGLGNIYQSSKIKQKWASKIYKTEEEL